MRLIAIGLICCTVALGRAPAEAQLRGHGGSVRALAISADGATALSGSFDTSAIRWSLRRQAADQVLRLHEGAVNAVAILDDDLRAMLVPYCSGHEPVKGISSDARALPAAPWTG